MVTILLGCSSPTPPLDSPPTTGPVEPGWYALEPLPVPTQENAVLAVASEVWVLGGFDDTLTDTDAVWIFDGTTWRAGPALPRPLHHLNAAVLDGDVYVLGALEGIGFAETAEGWVLPAGSSTWEAVTPLPSPLGAGAVGVVGREIFIAGGLADGTEAMGFAYDVDADTWRDLPALPEGRDHGVGAGGDAMRVFGGRDNGLFEVRDDVWELGPGGWEPRAPLPTARAGTAGAQLPDGTVVVAGGEGNDTDSDGIFEEMERYDPTADTWEALEPMPTPRHGTQAAWLDGGILVPGGATVQAFRATDTVEWLKLP